MNRSAIKDPMLHAAAEGIASHDHLRWLSYADDELRRLRERLGLPTPTGYSQGLPNYAIPASARAVKIHAGSDARCNCMLLFNPVLAPAEHADTCPLRLGTLQYRATSDDRPRSCVGQPRAGWALG